MWASGVKTGLVGLTSRCEVTQNTGQGIPNATPTKIQFNVITLDEKSEWDNTTDYRFIAQDTGLYHIDAHVILENINDGDVWEIQIRVDGVEVKQNESHGATSIYVGSPISANVWLDGGSYVEIFVVHNAGVSTALVNSPERNWLNIHRAQ